MPASRCARSAPDLAAKELSQSAEWDRPDAPDGLLRIARGLVALQGGEPEQAGACLREGVALAGGGVGGWFRAVLEAELMRCADDAPWLREALAGACRTAPTKEPVLAVASALGQVEAGETRRVVPSLLLDLRAWLLHGAGIAWSPAEFQVLADTFVRCYAYELLEAYARAAHRREPANPDWRFHEIVGRTRGRGHAMSAAEVEELDDMAEAASERRDFHAVTRIARFLGMDLPQSWDCRKIGGRNIVGLDSIGSEAGAGWCPTRNSPRLRHVLRRPAPDNVTTPNLAAVP